MYPKKKGPDDPNVNAVLKAMEEQDKKERSNRTRESQKKQQRPYLKSKTKKRLKPLKNKLIVILQQNIWEQK